MAQEGPYTLILVSVENLPMSGLADLVSTLEVMVDDIDNGTDIECAVFMRMDSRLIYIASEHAFMPQTSSCIYLHIYLMDHFVHAYIMVQKEKVHGTNIKMWLA